MNRHTLSVRAGRLTTVVLMAGASAAHGQAFVGKAFPDFTAKDSVTGETLRLSDLRGQVILVEFWATWCGPCRQSLPHLIQMHKKYKDKGFDVVAISLDFERDRDKYKQFIKENGLDWFHVMDGRGWGAELAAKNGVHSIPAVFLLDANGVCVADRSVLRDHTYFEVMLGNTLAKTPPVTTTAKRREEKKRREAERARLVAEAQREAPDLLALAARFTEQGQHEEARRFYTEVLQSYPETEFALKAQAALDKLPALPPPLPGA